MEPAFRGRGPRPFSRRRHRSPAVRVGVPRETAAGERRVALVPDSVGRLAQSGIVVVVETGRGRGGVVPRRGVPRRRRELGSPWDADAIVKVQKPSRRELERLREVRS